MVDARYRPRHLPTPCHSSPRTMKPSIALAMRMIGRVWINLRDRFPQPVLPPRTPSELARGSVVGRNRPRPTTRSRWRAGRSGRSGSRSGEDVFRRSAEIGYWLGRALLGPGDRHLGRPGGHRISPSSDFDLVRLHAGVFAWNAGLGPGPGEVGICPRRPGSESAVTKDGRTDGPAPLRRSPGDDSGPGLVRPGRTVCRACSRSPGGDRPIGPDPAPRLERVHPKFRLLHEDLRRPRAGPRRTMFWWRIGQDLSAGLDLRDTIAVWWGYVLVPAHASAPRPSRAFAA